MTSNEKTVLEEIRDLLLEQNRLLAQMIEKPTEREYKTEKPKFGKVERSDTWKEVCKIIFRDKPHAHERWCELYRVSSKRLGYNITEEARKKGFATPADYIEAQGLTGLILEIAEELFKDDVEEIPKFSLLKA